MASDYGILRRKGREGFVTEGAPARWFDVADDGGQDVPFGPTLILGCGPLPVENQRMNFAPGFRTWQFAKALADDGIAVRLVVMRIPGAYDNELASFERFEHDNIAVVSVTEDLFRRQGALEAAVDELRPRSVIAVSSATPASRAIEIAGDRPLWIDLFGDLMAEAQSRMTVHTASDLLAHSAVLLSALERGDAFSAVSDRQALATLGQLGLVGRLNRWTAAYTMVNTVPCCVFEEPRRGPEIGGSPEEFGEDDVIALWGGGFNTWCDADTFVDGMELAMKEDGSLRVAVTGGPIQGHDDSTYSSFLERVAGSRFSGRFVVKGQLQTREADAYLRRADLAVVTEKRFVERTLGSSGRVLRWLGAGIPVVCTELSELGSVLAHENLASMYRPGDPVDLARAVLELTSSRDASRSRAARARDYARRHWNHMETTTPLRRWARDPSRAPDAHEHNPLSLSDAAVVSLKLREVEEELQRFRDAYHRTRSELGSIHQSRMWKIWMSYQRLRRTLGLAAAGDRDDCGRGP